jgi:NAD(P)-dependent dehydrogenase (short-subunit alcohol dehydrogenase family)
MGEGRLSGKVAIVTGAASGIGRAAAELFRSEGALVVGADVNAGDGIVRADAGSESDVKRLIDDAAAEHGGLDIVFANAGISGGLASIFEQTAEDWAEILRVDLIGPFLAIKHAAPRLIARGGGSIICTASVAGLRSGAGGAAYSAAKAGVVSLVQTAANQLAGTNIRVNAICPGLIESGMTELIYEAARAKGTAHRIGELNPLQRGGEPMEIARAALFLASDESSYVNGQALAVDGGLTSSMPTARRFEIRAVSEPARP